MSKNEIRQHIPAFMDGFDAQSASFEALDELVAIPFVASWTKQKDFHKFSDGDGLLIAELRGGRSWWVVGRLKELVKELPPWDRGIYEVIDQDGTALDIPGKDVRFSCGDIVGLRDGREFKRRIA